MKQKYDPQKHKRRSVRLKGYDYSCAGAYFVTICVKDRKCVLGDVHDGKVRLSAIGKIAYEWWNEIPCHFNLVTLDEFIIMPNHLHGVVLMTDNGRGVQLNAPTAINPWYFYKSISPKLKTLSVVIRTFKAAVTTQCRRDNYHSFEWQRNYYEHIIRNEDELNAIREYVIDNPLYRQFDRENLEQDKSYHKTWSQVEERIYGKEK
jgi:REP element-mobilizing transposase RayT